MLVLATLLENPGEPPIQTRYRDPAVLARRGYTGWVIHRSTALSGLPSPDVIEDGELRGFARALLDQIDDEIAKARAAGLAVYLSYDAGVLAGGWMRAKPMIQPGRSRTDALDPGHPKVLELSCRALEGWLRRWPELAGVVLRIGDHDAARTPFLYGGDLYREQRHEAEPRAERAAKVIEAYRKLTDTMDRTLIVRAWNVHPGGMHDDPDIARGVAERLPVRDDGRLIFSFKHTRTDFWRYQPWNPGIAASAPHPVIVELECQREFEGKGGIPNWQAPLWLQGPSPDELTSGESGESGGLATLRQDPRFAGVSAWVRGGGWGGPFVKDERWIDANVDAASRLVREPQATLSEMAQGWVRDRLGQDHPAVVEAMSNLMLDSAELARQAFYLQPYAIAKGDPWEPGEGWIQDDLIRADAAWKMLQSLSEDELDQAVLEKRAAASGISQHRARLQHLLMDRSHRDIEPLVNTLVYTESLYQALRDLIDGLVAYRQFQRDRGSRAYAKHAHEKLLSAQSHWNHHTQRHASVSGVATPFRESEFWELTQRILDEVDTVVA